MRRLALMLASVAMLTLAAPVAAQSMQGMNMPGMTMPAQKKPAAKSSAPAKRARAKPVAAKRKAPPKATADPMAGMTGMDHSSMPGMAMPGNASQPAQGASQSMPEMEMPASGQTAPQGAQQAMPGMNMSGDQHGSHDMQAMPGMAGMTMPGMEKTGTALPAGNAPAPAPPMDHYADRQFAPADMAKARHDMMFEQGGQPFYQVMFNLAEYQARQGRDGYRWDGEAWFGGDINRLWLKSEGEGALREGVESAEVQALYSRAVGPYFNLQAGVRHDFQPSPNRTYATVGFEGLSPYMFEVEGALFLSTKGDLLGRLEGYYDQRITQRLILQPRIEFNLSAQAVPENRLGAGLTDAELGLRLRYEIRRQFAPYIGVSYVAQTGRTADFTRAEGKDPTTTSFVAGVRVWF
ncbi:copper resistance protein B [Sphingomonas sp. AAP5]|uniref:copper resistance protein B n=1 Tax=Sphingomonas sp. AAP5 TaxID=1523415 RepID=UPI00105710D9|nr:copper resistance protein B [Sphingomonas sp. AAP5]QBM75954.1 copper resistance protein B [Sphingomonas sp. AAP5]